MISTFTVRELRLNRTGPSIKPKRRKRIESTNQLRPARRRLRKHSPTLACWVAGASVPEIPMQQTIDKAGSSDAPVLCTKIITLGLPEQLKSKSLTFSVALHLRYNTHIHTHPHTHTHTHTHTASRFVLQRRFELSNAICLVKDATTHAHTHTHTKRIQVAYPHGSARLLCALCTERHNSGNLSVALSCPHSRNNCHCRRCFAFYVKLGGHSIPELSARSHLTHCGSCRV